MKLKFFLYLPVVLFSLKLTATPLTNQLRTLSITAINTGASEALIALFPYLDKTGQKLVEVAFNKNPKNQDTLTPEVLNQMKAAPAPIIPLAAPANAEEFAQRYVDTMNQNALAIAQGFTDQNMQDASAKRVQMQQVTAKVATALQ